MTNHKGVRTLQRMWIWHEDRNKWTKTERTSQEPPQKKDYLRVPKRSLKPGRDVKRAAAQRSNDERLEKIKERHGNALSGITFAEGGHKPRISRRGSLQERLNERAMMSRWTEFLEKRIFDLGIAKKDAADISKQAVFTELDQKKWEFWEIFSKGQYGKVNQPSIHEYDFITGNVKLT